MKHKIIIILSLLIMGNIPLLAYENYYGVAILSHQGQETAYAADNVQAAVEGDVIVLSPGNFKEFTLNKQIRLEKHSGGNSVRVNLDLPDNSVVSNSLFSGGHFEVVVKSNIQNIYFSECGINPRTDNGGSIGNVTFDRCDIGSLYYNEFSVNTLYANNCSISGIYNGQSTNTVSKFTNCMIFWNFDVVGATFDNCILYDDEVNTIANCILTNCLYDAEMIVVGDNSQANGCYNMSMSEWNDSQDYLLSNNFLGTDGTVVGQYGGANPFPYEGIGPKVGPDIWSGSGLKYQDGKVTGTYYINPTH